MAVARGVLARSRGQLRLPLSCGPHPPQSAVACLTVNRLINPWSNDGIGPTAIPHTCGRQLGGRWLALEHGGPNRHAATTVPGGCLRRFSGLRSPTGICTRRGTVPRRRRRVEQRLANEAVRVSVAACHVRALCGFLADH